MRKYSIALGVAGGLLPAFGVFRLVTELDAADPFVLVVWLAAAVVLHDGLIAPITVGTGVTLACRSAKTQAFPRTHAGDVAHRVHTRVRRFQRQRVHRDPAVDKHARVLDHLRGAVHGYTEE